MHRGASQSSGHYWSIAKHTRCDGTDWWLYNDSLRKRASEDERLSPRDALGPGKLYLLFYERLPSVISHALTPASTEPSGSAEGHIAQNAASSHAHSELAENLTVGTNESKPSLMDTYALSSASRDNSDTLGHDVPLSSLDTEITAPTIASRSNNGNGDPVCHVSASSRSSPKLAASKPASAPLVSNVARRSRSRKRGESRPNGASTSGRSISAVHNVCGNIGQTKTNGSINLEQTATASHRRDDGGSLEALGAGTGTDGSCNHGHAATSSSRKDQAGILEA